jgi:hypothetical protein
MSVISIIKTINIKIIYSFAESTRCSGVIELRHAALNHPSREAVLSSQISEGDIEKILTAICFKIDLTSNFNFRGIITTYTN